MIRNNRKLLQAEQKLVAAKAELESILESYTGIDQELYAIPIRNIVEDLESEIKEYKELVESSFEDSVERVLIKPCLLGNISELLTKLRIAKDITQADMAERLGWQQSNLSRFESVNYGSHTVAKILEYAAELDVWLYVAPRLEEIEEVEGVPEYESVIQNLASSIQFATNEAISAEGGGIDTRRVLAELESGSYINDSYFKGALSDVSIDAHPAEGTRQLDAFFSRKAGIETA